MKRRRLNSPERSLSLDDIDQMSDLTSLSDSVFGDVAPVAGPSASANGMSTKL